MAGLSGAVSERQRASRFLNTDATNRKPQLLFVQQQSIDCINDNIYPALKKAPFFIKSIAMLTAAALSVLQAAINAPLPPYNNKNQQHTHTHTNGWEKKRPPQPPLPPKNNNNRQQQQQIIFDISGTLHLDDVMMVRKCKDTCKWSLSSCTRPLADDSCRHAHWETYPIHGIFPVNTSMWPRDHCTQL